MSFITKEKKICVLQCCSAEYCNAKLMKQKPGVKSQSPSQATNHLMCYTGKSRNQTFTSGSRASKMQFRGHFHETLSSLSGVRAAAKLCPSSLVHNLKFSSENG